jgi:Tfp pilus assembly PilM family ATPase
MSAPGSSFLSRAFPVPHALTLSHAAVSLSDGVLRTLVLTHARGALVPKSWSEAPIPRLGKVADAATDGAAEMEAGAEPSEGGGGSHEGGAVRKEIAAALRKFAVQNDIRSAAAIVHEGDAYAFTVRVPFAAERELHGAIESSLEENVPIPPSEVVFEYGVVRRDEARGELVVAVCAVSRRASDLHAGILREAGIFPVGLETEARALSRALVPRADHGTHALLSIMERHSVVAVVERGYVTFSSSIEVGAADLDRAVAKTFSIQPEEARGLRRDGAKKSAKAPGEDELFESMIPVFSTVRDELSKVISYARGQAARDGGDGVSDVIVCGADALFPGFSRYITATTRLPAVTASVWTNALSVDRDLPGIDRQSSFDYAALIGAILPER